MTTATRMTARTRCVRGSSPPSCGVPTGGPDLPDDAQASDRPLPVILGDETGLVVGVEPVSMDFTTWTDTPRLRADPADARAAVLSFLGGMCDQDVKLAFRLHKAVYELRVDVAQKPGSAALRQASCDPFGS